jgi:ribosomal protein S18 acetylase RimI-like enzyme
MEYAPLTDRDQIEQYLNNHPELFVYSLGDLEDEFWSHTTWYGAIRGDDIEAICLVFTKYDAPIVQAICEPGNRYIARLLSAILPNIPPRSRIHFCAEADDVVSNGLNSVSRNSGWKMAFRNRSTLSSIDVSNVERLSVADVDGLNDLYTASYEESSGAHVFDSSMLDVGPYYGVKMDGQLVSAAGVHVFSPRFNVAAVANVATLPEQRSRGLASAVTARLCQELIADVDHIGLNVEGMNEAAVRAYERVGFEKLTEFYAVSIKS